MFEKEAKQYGDNYVKSKYMETVDETWKKGAEFGYNKANEWHEDSPTEDIRLAIIEVKDCGYLLCEYRKGVWYDEGSSAVCKDWITRNIKRWKEIVLPELKENE